MEMEMEMSRRGYWSFRAKRETKHLEIEGGGFSVFKNF